MEIIDEVKKVADAFGVPDWIWYPALMNESGGNPGVIADTGSEYSVGLFQINTMAHPQYSADQLKNPIVNATIAMKDFLKPAYDYVTGTLGLTDKADIARAVYFGINPRTGDYYSAEHGGIRPVYTKSNIQRFMGYFNQYWESGTEGIRAALDLFTGNADKTGDFLTDKLGQASNILHGTGTFFIRVTLYLILLFLLITLVIILFGSSALSDTVELAVDLIKQGE